MIARAGDLAGTVPPVVLQEPAPTGPTAGTVALVAVVLGLASLAVGFLVGRARSDADTGAPADSPDSAGGTEPGSAAGSGAGSGPEPGAGSAPGPESATGSSPAAAAADSRPRGSSSSVDSSRAASSASGSRSGSTTRGREDQSASASDEGGPPERIPGAPDLAVSYGALTDEEPIGGGGNADVVRATMPASGADVPLAVKTPRLGGTLHASEVERMIEEAETWAGLDDHDHVVGVVDYGTDPLPWIAMEYMDGGSLAERVGELPLDRALWTAIAVTEAVRHAHRHGVAHLDLKPENVLFRSVEGAWDAPKVADWGLSKHLLDHSKSVEGFSPHYAAPEQFDDEFGPTDDVTDVYQLGATLYALFAGRPPFEGSPTEVMRSVVDDRPPAPSEVADLPPALDDALLPALATDRDERYDSVVYLRDALAAVREED